MTATPLNRIRGALLLVAAACASPLSAQTSSPAGDPLRLLGLSVATSGGPRDTLGLLVASVTRDGPADQAGITTGNRIVAVNGQVTRLGADEVGRRTATDSAISRFVRAVRGAPSTGEVTLKVSGGGATRTVALPLTGAIIDPNSAPAPRPAPANAGASPGIGTVLSPPAQVVLIAPSSAPPPTSAPAATPVVAAPAPPIMTAAIPVDSTTTRTTPQPVSPAPAPAPGPVAPAVVAVAATAVPISATPTEPKIEPAHDASLPRIVDLLGQVQLELRRVARESSALTISDSLADLEWQLSGIRRRLRALTGASVTPATDNTPGVLDSTSVLARWLRAADRLDARAAQPTPGRASTAPLAVSPAPPAPAVTVASPAVVSAPASTTPAAAAPGIELASVSGDLAAYLGAQAESAVVVLKATEAYEPLRAGDVILQADGVAPNLGRLRATLTAHARVSLTLLRRGRMFTVLVGDATH